MKYVRCINNRGFITDTNGKLFDEVIDDLVVGQIYKVAPPAENDGDELRIVDESGEDYLYPADYFEPVKVNGGRVSEVVTLYLDPTLKGILHAEALAAQKSVNALLREWIDERLDLPVGP